MTRRSNSLPTSGLATNPLVEWEAATFPADDQIAQIERNSNPTFQQLQHPLNDFDALCNALHCSTGILNEEILGDATVLLGILRDFGRAGRLASVADDQNSAHIGMSAISQQHLRAIVMLGTATLTDNIYIKSILKEILPVDLDGNVEPSSRPCG